MHQAFRRRCMNMEVFCTNHPRRIAISGKKCCLACLDGRNSRRENYRVLGLCCVCGRMPSPGYKTCDPCRNRDKKSKDHRKSRGLCGCGNHPAPNRKKCTDCLVRAKNRTTAFVNSGFCFCGNSRPERGLKLCRKCLDKKASTHRKFKSEGKCQCGNPLSHNLRLCSRCRRRARDKMTHRIKTDPLFAITTRLRSLLHGAIKRRRGYSKTGRTEILMGCTFTFAQSHIESLFLPGMSWSNTKLWHIDHYIPCSSFNLGDEREQRLCNNWRNLRPIWASENLSKKDMIPVDYKERLAELELHVPHIDPMNDPAF